MAGFAGGIIKDSTPKRSKERKDTREGKGEGKEEATGSLLPP